MKVEILFTTMADRQAGIHTGDTFMVAEYPPNPDKFLLIKKIGGKLVPYDSNANRTIDKYNTKILWVHDNPLSRLINRLAKMGIVLTLASNYPWVYLRKVNELPVTEKYGSEHGFVIGFDTQPDNNFKFSDISKVMSIIRKYRDEYCKNYNTGSEFGMELRDDLSDGL